MLCVLILNFDVVESKTGVNITYPGSLCTKGPTYSTGVKATM